MRKYKLGICIKCGEDEYIYARDMCKKCYSSYLYNKRKSDPDFIQMKKEWSKNDYEKRKDFLLDKQKKLREENPDLYRDRVKKSMRKHRKKLKSKGMNINEEYLFGGNRLKALQRDGFACLQCQITMDDSKESYNMPLVVHHIDGNGFNIKNSKNKNNKLSNLATLCVACHTKEHKRIRDGNKPRSVSEFGSML